MTEIHPLIIIGSGPAAWTAAIYAARAGLSPIVLAGEQSGGQLMLTTKIENYPGFPEGVMGPDLMTAMRQQAEKQGVKIIDKDATGINKDEDIFVVRVGSTVKQSTDSPAYRPTDYRPTVSPLHRSTAETPNVLKSKSVIIATGAAANTLKLPGEERLMGRGVGTCAVCDAPLYRGKNTVFVIGGGDSAAEEAAELAKFVNKTIILVRKDTMRAGAAMHNRIKSLQNIEIWYKAEAKEFLGEKQLNRVKIVKDGKETVLPADGVFYAIGHTPATAWLTESGVALDEKGYIITPLSTVISPKSPENSENSENRNVRKSDNQKTGNSDAPILRPSDSSGAPVRDVSPNGTLRPSIPSVPKSPYATITSIPGIFAAGDCVDPRYRQAITAAGYGCMAALDAQKWLGNALIR